MSPVANTIGVAVPPCNCSTTGGASPKAGALDRPGKFLYRRYLQQDRWRQGDAEFIVNIAQHLHSHQRIATKISKFVQNADLIDLEDARPDRSEHRFERTTWRRRRHQIELGSLASGNWKGVQIDLPVLAGWQFVEKKEVGGNACGRHVEFYGDAQLRRRRPGAFRRHNIGDQALCTVRAHVHPNHNTTGKGRSDESSFDRLDFDRLPPEAGLEVDAPQVVEVPPRIKSPLIACAI